ncbi:hypothetical protein GGR55DRAFT_673401 [Xylaria sp. FL0064]|nr:hypothetical protein GGR55DRAFT_673401 [Xylaria sp. FL0064]
MEDDWSEVSDAAIRKRIQNRLAQRKHRQKAQTQAQARAKKSAEKAVGGSGHPQVAQPSPSLFLPSSSPIETRASTEGMSGEAWAADFTHNVPMPTTQDAGLEAPWNLLASENGNGGGNMDSNWGEDSHRGPGRAQLPRRSRTARIMTEERAGQIANPQQYDESMLPDLDAIVSRTMMYPEMSNWMSDSSYNPSFHITGGVRYRAEQDATHQRDLSSDEKEHCETCDHRRHRSNREKASVSNAYNSSGNNSSSRQSGLPPAGSVLASPISPAPTSPTLSRVLRDHNIELDHLMSQASHSRRQSIGAASTEGGGGRGGIAHTRQLKRRYSDINAPTIASSGAQQHDQASHLQPLPNVPEQQQYDVIERHEYTQSQESEDDPGPKVTKVVVIYMQERQR